MWGVRVLCGWEIGFEVLLGHGVFSMVAVSWRS